MIHYHILDSIGIKFKVKIDTNLGEIKIKDAHGNKVGHAKLDYTKKTGTYVLYNKDDGKVFELQRDLVEDLAHEDGRGCAQWLCDNIT
jgi:hypothetical protein